MADEVAARIEEAIGTGEVLGIVYHGGSNPGAFRQIIPLQINGHQVRARCYSSNAVKGFLLAKIELCPAAVPLAGEVVWSLPAAPVWTFTTLEGAAAHFRPQLEALGWHVEYGPSDEGEALRIFARLKNGKPRRTAAVTFGYEAVTHDLGMAPNGTIVRFNERPRVRPWSVRANGKANSWGRLDGAVQAFIAAAGLTVVGAVATA